MRLLEVQKAALKASNGKQGFAYFMEQGLGKTLTTFADFLEHVAAAKTTRMLVVCPNSFKAGWVEDAKKHGVDLDFFIWEAGNHAALRAFICKPFKKPPCVIVNWESIRPIKKKVGKTYQYLFTELGEIIREYVTRRPTFVAYDESVQAKGHDSAQTVGAIMISKEVLWANGAARILSGKPVVQGPHDLWGQMRLIGALDGFNYYAFRNAFCKMGGFKMKSVTGAINEDVLAERIAPYVFRATKADWTDLPPKLYTAREYTMTPEMKKMYKQMEDEFVLWLSESEVVTVDVAITKYIKLAQIQCGWIYDEVGKVRWLVEDDKNPRLNGLKETLETEVIGKTIIPYHHKPVFEQLTRNFGEDSSAWITGGMTPAEIEEQKRRFNEDPKVRRIFLQTRASKYGHTLLGDQTSIDNRCHNMVFYENTYSLDDRSQIEDRSHRHGQLADSMLYTDLVGTKLDRDCVKALQRKEGVFQAVFAHLRNQS